MSGTMINDLTVGSVPKQLLRFSIPFVLSSIMQTLYSLVDMVVVGQFVGSAGLSAVGISGQLIMLFTSLGMGFASAARIIISQFVGSKDHDGISATIGTQFTLLGILAVFICVIGILLRHPILSIMNTPAEAYSQAVDYLVICLIGLIFTYGYNAVSSVLIGMGESKLPFVFIAIASVANVVLDLLFVAVFHMEAAGAALATIMGQAFSFIVSLVYLYKRREAFGFDFKLHRFKIDTVKLKMLLKLGLPMAIDSVAITLSMLFVNSLVNSYGLVASAVDSVGGKLNGVMAIATGSITSSGAAMIGQNIGARKLERVSKIYWYSLLVCMISFVVVSALVLAFPREVFSLFNNEEAVLAMAPTYLRIATVFFLSFATMAPPLALVNGVGNARLGLIIAILDGVIARIALTLILQRFMGLEGLWLGNALAGFVTTIIGMWYYHSKRWKTRKLIIEQD